MMLHTSLNATMSLPKYQLSTLYGFRDTAQVSLFPLPACLPAQLAMGENPHTTLKGCGVKTGVQCSADMT